MAEPTRVPSLPQGIGCQSLSLPESRGMEVPVQREEGWGQGKVAPLPSVCYFGPTKSQFLLRLCSNASDKTPHSHLFP